MAARASASRSGKGTSGALAAPSVTVENRAASPQRSRRRQPPRRAQIISTFRPEGMRGPVLPLVRRDALPEHATYADNGCELARSCLRCPLPRCQYDAPRSVERWLIAARDREIAYMRRRHGVAVETLARAYGVGERRVWSILRARRMRRDAGSQTRKATATKREPG